MAQDQWLGHLEAADPAVLVVVHVGATDPDGGDADEHLVRGRCGDRAVLDAELAGGAQHRGTHGGRHQSTLVPRGDTHLPGVCLLAHRTPSPVRAVRAPECCPVVAARSYGASSGPGSKRPISRHRLGVPLVAGAEEVVDRGHRVVLARHPYRCAHGIARVAVDADADARQQGGAEGADLLGGGHLDRDAPGVAQQLRPGRAAGAAATRRARAWAPASGCAGRPGATGG